jgi:TPR repeat protein
VALAGGVTEMTKSSIGSNAPGQAETMPKNLTEAYKWFSLAAATGDAEAAKRRDLVKAELPAAARAGADQAIKA